ncbi:MAG: hypothetical protein QGH59_10265, partial [Gemmatimonadota bacterium]|nr:hypothetical protein [Gemmatimonadota bacterium]
RLIGDWVAILVGAFLIQGVWLGLRAALVRPFPSLAEPLNEMTAFFGLWWMGLACFGGLLFGLWRGRAALSAPSRQRR